MKLKLMLLVGLILQGAQAESPVSQHMNVWKKQFVVRRGVNAQTSGRQWFGYDSESGDVLLEIDPVTGSINAFSSTLRQLKKDVHNFIKTRVDQKPALHQLMKVETAEFLSHPGTDHVISISFEHTQGKVSQKTLQELLNAKEITLSLDMEKITSNQVHLNLTLSVDENSAKMFIFKGLKV